MAYSFSMRTEILSDAIARATGGIEDWIFVGDSTNGCQTDSLYAGTRDFAFLASMPIIRTCAGALYVQPWNGGSIIADHPWFFPFFTIAAATDGHRQMGVLTNASSAFTAYSVHDTAPADDDGDTPATTYPGEVKSSDCRDTMEFCIAQGADSWPSNGTGGVVQMGNSGNDAIRRCVLASFPSESGWSFTSSDRFGYMWNYLPGVGTGTRTGHASFQIFARRRNIPAPGGANKYDTAQIQIQRQSYNGSLTGLSGSSASTPIATAGNWTNVGSVIPTGTDYAYQIYTMTPASPVHGIGILGTGADYNDAATARGFAIGGVSSLYDGVTRGLRTGIMTRGGFKNDTLNDAVHDGSATDPQRIILEGTAPDLLWLTFGANDAAAVTAANFAAEYATFIDRVLVYRPTQKFVVVIPYIGTRAATIAARMVEYKYALIEMARSRPNVCLLDLQTPSMAFPSGFFDGGPHLNTNDSGVPAFTQIMRDNLLGNRRPNAFRPRYARRKARMA